MKLEKRWTKAWTFIIPAISAVLSWSILILEELVLVGNTIPPEVLGEKGVIIIALFSSILAVARLVPQKNMENDE